MRLVVWVSPPFCSLEVTIGLFSIDYAFYEGGRYFYRPPHLLLTDDISQRDDRDRASCASVRFLDAEPVATSEEVSVINGQLSRDTRHSHSRATREESSTSDGSTSRAEVNQFDG